MMKHTKFILMIKHFIINMNEVKMTLKSLLGFCEHKWNFIRTERNPLFVVEILECEKCGTRKSECVL